jgi:hypothetical protein
MIDNLSILLSHSLLLLAFWLLTKRDDLDSEPPPEPDAQPQGFGVNHRRPNATKGPQPDA